LQRGPIGDGGELSKKKNLKRKKKQYSTESAQ